METKETLNAQDSPPRRKIVVSSKYDGTRVKVIKKNGVVTLVNRHGIDYTHRLTERRDCGGGV